MSDALAILLFAVGMICLLAWLGGHA